MEGLQRDFVILLDKQSHYIYSMYFLPVTHSFSLSSFIFQFQPAEVSIHLKILAKTYSHACEICRGLVGVHIYSTSAFKVSSHALDTLNSSIVSFLSEHTIQRFQCLHIELLFFLSKGTHEDTLHLVHSQR